MKMKVVVNFFFIWLFTWQFNRNVKIAGKIRRLAKLPESYCKFKRTKWIVLTLNPNCYSFLHCQIQWSLEISLKACLWDTSSDAPELLRTSHDHHPWP